MKKVTRSSPKTVDVALGRIIDVHTDSYTVDVVIQNIPKPTTGISFATPYQNGSGRGEGIYFMPEVGSMCWVCWPSDGRAFVLAWSSMGDEGDFRSGKESLDPGDIYLGTRDGNSVVLKRGGVLQIGSTPLSQRLYLPVNNTIRDFAENYYLHTLGGSLEWTVDRPVESTDGSRPSKLSISAKEYAGDSQPIASLEMGSHGDDDEAILSLTVRDSGSNTSVVKSQLSIGKDGKVFWKISEDMTVESRNFLLTVDENANVVVGKGFEVEAGSVDVVSKGNAIVKAGSSIDLKGVKTNIDNSVWVGGGVQPVAMAVPLISYLLAHYHISGPPGVPTSPPALPVPEGIISKSIFGK